MRELSLFTGGGGGVLGSLLLGWQTVGYVEYEDYPQRILKQRMDDGILCQAPIFGDIRAFISEGYAESYQGMVDVITAGFPCQPFSVAGKQLGADDPRNMWPATIATIRIVRPQSALLENVPGLLGSGYFGRILGDLAESGYDARWTVLGADDCGAPHRRKRLWILANSRRKYGEGQEVIRKYKIKDRTWDAFEPERPTERNREGVNEGTNVAYTNMQGLEGWERDTMEPGQQQTTFGQRDTPFGRNWGWQSEPNVGRVANGVASRVDRLKAIGNGQVPIVAATAWKLLTEKS